MSSVLSFLYFYRRGEDLIPEFDMCFDNGTLFTNEELLVKREFILSTAIHNCVCRIGRKDAVNVDLSLYKFQCDDSEIPCPWKLEIFKDGCLEKDYCCKSSWSPLRVPFKADLSTIHLRMTQANTRTIKFSSQIRISTKDDDGSNTAMETQCGAPEDSAEFCPTTTTEELTTTTEALTTTTEALTTTTEELTTTAEATTKEESRTRFSDDTIYNPTEAGQSVSGSDSTTIAIAVGAAAGAAAILLILVAFICCCCSRSPSGSETGIGPMDKPFVDEDPDEPERYQTTLPMTTRSTSSRQMTNMAYDGGEMYQNIPGIPSNP
ncbi:hypothetical protein CAPTEDRAFT_219893 [Capitella teleta]|uniref:Uncharacterized protein n=1 Tax=Capitella teleta TaxID=283909 RepID=R7TZN2_CAPTE|nr:hypothetical protein CAPTEDRAFT_219893 [Capitella teleta]|eukprot:ELT99408.1 hypothetical protein CAPTEDRAFT_219893 [Capitella teleta]